MTTEQIARLAAIANECRELKTQIITGGRNRNEIDFLLSELEAYKVILRDDYPLVYNLIETFESMGE